jgi:aerobic-type carbon monoxide dehydrogenase small subunit (CoxS/CutS family)
MPGTDPLRLVVDGAPVEVDVAPGETLLSVLRERLGITAVKDGCAPQGQCGCCTVLVDGAPRVACVTPAERVDGRTVTTPEGLTPAERAAFGDAFCDTGGSQCGFCTPGIVVRLAGLARAGRTATADLDRALAAHVCRCTGWRTVYEAADLAAAWSGREGGASRPPPRTLGRELPRRVHAGRRAALEGGTPQRAGADVPLGAGGFADDTAPRDALAAVPRPPGSNAESVGAAGLSWVVAETLLEARVAAGKVQGRNAPGDLPPPLAPPDLPAGGVRLATGWVEPAYLEPDASWCVPGGQPATPLANGGAFGGKVASLAPAAARELAEILGRPVRVVLSREDTVRLGPKRPPVAASAVLDGGVVRIAGRVVAPGAAFGASYPWPYALDVHVAVEPVRVPGPPVSDALRAAGWAEQVVLVEGALDAAGADRAALVADDAAGAVLLDSCVVAPSGARAGARVDLDAATGRIEAVLVRVDAGDPLDNVVLRSYCLGGAHMALGWVLREGVAVDPVSGEVLDLTIRSFGIIRAKDTPPIEVEVVGASGPPLAGAGDAVFAAVAAATWNAISALDDIRPEAFPARTTRTAATLR